MTRKRDRFFALFGAILFLATASALTVAVIIDGVTRKDDASTATSTAADTSSTSDTNSTTKDSKEKTMLQGTPLKDFTPVSKIDSLQKQDLTVGTGEAVKAGDNVTVDYTGAVAATGTIFQSSLDSGQTASFGLNQVIKGWTDGVPGMQVGGVRRLLIPADQAYGANPPSGSGIPANADLVFDITLHKIGS